MFDEIKDSISYIDTLLELPELNKEKLLSIKEQLEAYLDYRYEILED